MNGIMVTLLTLCMTGIVSGQQIDSSNLFRASTNRSGATTLPAANLATPPSQFQQPTGPFEIEISAAQIAGLRQGKVLDTTIEPMDPVSGKVLSTSVVNEISLIHVSNLGRFLNSEVLQGSSSGNGVIQFKLNDQDLANLQTKKLTFKFNARDIGQFDRVLVRYVPSNPRTVLNPNAVTTPVPDNAFGASPFTNPTLGTTGSQPGLPIPRNNFSPGEAGYMGPTRQPAGNLAANNSIPSLPQRSTWNPPTPLDQTNSNLALPLAAGANPPRRAVGNLPITAPVTQPTNGQLGPRFPITTAPIRTNGLQPIIPSVALSDADRLAQQQTQIRQAADLQDQRSFELTRFQDDLLAANARLKEQMRDFELKQYAANLPTNNHARLGDRFASRNTSFPLDNVDQPISTDRAKGLGSLNGSAQGMTNTSLRDPTIPPKTANKSDSVAETANTRTLQIFYLMLLGSFGLNVVLAIYARNFYARYGELANELRETFSTTL